MVSEYKTKLQIAEAENTRLEGMVSLLSSFRDPLASNMLRGPFYVHGPELNQQEE